MTRMFTIPALAIAIAFTAACSEPEVAAPDVVEPETADVAPDVAPVVKPEDLYDGVVAAIEDKGVSAAEAAWAKQRPTLLIFAASW